MKVTQKAVRRGASRGMLVAAVAVMTLAGSQALVDTPAGAQARTGAARDLPGLVSEKRAPRPADLPAGDFSDPPEIGKRAKAAPIDPARSRPLDAETTLTKRVTANSNGSRTIEVHGRPVRYQDAAGAWRDFDLTLVPGADATLGATAAPRSARLGANAGATVASVATEAGTVSLRHPGAVAVAAVVAKDRATYPKALSGGRDLVLTATPDGFEEAVVLPNAAAGGTYVEEFVLAPGMSARTTEAGVEFLGAGGQVVASYGRGLAHDATFATSGLPSAATPVTVRLATPTGARAESPAAGGGSVVSVEVSVDAGWLATPGRAYPVTIDPFFAQRTTEAGTLDTFVLQQAATTAYATWPQLVIGLNGGNLYRSLLSFNLGSLPGANVYVTESHLTLVNYVATTCVAKPVHIFGLGSAFTAATTWATQPGLDATGLVSTSNFNHGATGCAPAAENLDVTSLAQRWMGGGAPNFGLELRADESDGAGFKVFYSGENAYGAIYAPALSITYDHLPDQATPTGDPEAGHKVVDSGWIAATSYPVLPGALSDGVTYTWHTWTRDPTAWREPDPNARRSFTVDLGLGDAAQPRDSVGPVTVDLTSGNVATGAASPQFPTVGGAMGLSYSYNSGAPSPTAGLTAGYFDDPTGSRSFTGKTPAMVRADASVNFAWGAGAPVPGVGADNFLVRWSGYLTVPTTGSYTLYTTNDDGVRLKVAGTTIIDRWVDGTIGVTGTAVANPVNLTGGTPVAIELEYYDRLGPAYVGLSAVGPSGPGGASENFAIRPAWLSSAPAALPAGWSASARLAGQLSYLSARVSGSTVVLSELGGNTHVYTATAGGYRPEGDEDGVLARDGAGRLTLAARDGITYVFNAEGNLASATSATDDLNPAAPRYVWDGTPSRLRTITDPVSAKAITLRYGGDAACPSPAPTGLAVAPTLMLCSASYPDATQTKFWYTPPVANQPAQLARIEDPGGARPASPPVSDFAYDAGGRLAQVRSPLVADALAAGVITAAADSAGTHRSLITYESATGKAASVTLAAPAPGSTANRPVHTYEYISAVATGVHVPGSDESATGFARKVTFDARGRMLTDTDATGHALAATWDGIGRMTSSTDAAGRMTTMLYDLQGRPSHTYGPAPASCFDAATLVPAGPCAGLGDGMAHAATVYDGGLAGLAATYWNNPTMAGAPKLHRTGTSATLVAASPDPVLGSAWSARFTGEITLAAASNLQLSASAGSTATLLVDDVPVLPGDSVALGLQRIEADFVAGPSPTLALQARPTGSGSFTTVAAGALGPRYGLVTRTTTEDATTTSPARVQATTYGGAGAPDPATGLAGSVVEDPGTGRANLTTTMTYETGGFLRPLSKALPAGNASTTAYYEPTEGGPAVCGQAAGVNQGGLPKLSSAPSPDGGATPAWTRGVVYDLAGRPIATRRNAENWTCTAYDARGRVSSVAIAAQGAPLSTAARTVSHAYAVGINLDPRTSTVSDATPGTSAIAATVDLLGRVVSSTDAWNKTTTSTYDIQSRLSDTSGPDGARHRATTPPGGPPPCSSTPPPWPPPATTAPASWRRWPTPTAPSWRGPGRPAPPPASPRPPASDATPPGAAPGWPSPRPEGRRWSMTPSVAPSRVGWSPRPSTPPPPRPSPTTPWGAW